jgi:hypothetical protein
MTIFLTRTPVLARAACFLRPCSYARQIRSERHVLGIAALSLSFQGSDRFLMELASRLPRAEISFSMALELSVRIFIRGDYGDILPSLVHLQVVALSPHCGCTSTQRADHCYCDFGGTSGLVCLDTSHGCGKSWAVAVLPQSVTRSRFDGLQTVLTSSLLKFSIPTHDFSSLKLSLTRC